MSLPRSPVWAVQPITIRKQLHQLVLIGIRQLVERVFVDERPQVGVHQDRVRRLQVNAALLRLAYLSSVTQFPLVPSSWLKFEKVFVWFLGLVPTRERSPKFRVSHFLSGPRQFPKEKNFTFPCRTPPVIVHKHVFLQPPKIFPHVSKLC